MTLEGPAAALPAPLDAGEGPGSSLVALIVRLRPLLVLIAAVVVPVGVAVGLVPFRSNLTPATVALGLAVVVSLVAAIGTRFSACVAAVAAALCFDILFTKPYGSFSISSAPDIETAVLLLVGGLIVGQLSARNRSNKGLVAQSSDDLARIQAIAEMMADGAPPDDIVAAVGEELRDMLGLRGSRFETSIPNRPGPTIERNGDVSWGHFWWGIDSLGLPGKEITIPVEHQQRRLGRYVLIAEPGTKVRRGQLLAAVTLADQAGAALGAGGAPELTIHA